MVLYWINILSKFSRVIVQAINFPVLHGVAGIAFRHLSALLDDNAFHTLYHTGIPEESLRTRFRVLVNAENKKNVLV